MSEQKAYRFDKETTKKVIKGAIIAGSGAVAVPILEYIAKQDFGAYSPFVAAGCAILVNAVREFIKGKK